MFFARDSFRLRITFVAMATTIMLLAHVGFADQAVLPRPPVEPSAVSDTSTTGQLSPPEVDELLSRGMSLDEIRRMSVGSTLEAVASRAAGERPEALPPLTGDGLGKHQLGLDARPDNHQAEYLMRIDIERALIERDWQRLRELAAELPRSQVPMAVERVLLSAPRERAELVPGPPMTAADEAYRLEEFASRHALDLRRQMAARALQDMPSDEPETPSYSTIGRVEHHEGPLPPGKHHPEATLTVGDGCTYSTLQTAIDAAASGDYIHVQGRTYTGSSATVNISGKSLYIYGGYNSTCTTQDGSTTVLDATGVADSVIEIFGSAGQTILFQYFKITGGSADADHGGGIEISTDQNVILRFTDITGNSSNFGGGVHMTAGTLDLDSATVLALNSATNDGGGIYCANAYINVENSVIGSTVLGGNVADGDGNNVGNGGGVYLDACSLSMGIASGFGGIYDNQGFYGGGIYATGSSFISLSGNTTTVGGNTAVDSGGGLFLTNGSSVWGDCADVLGNEALDIGGGLMGLSAGTIIDFDDLLCAGGARTEIGNNQGGSSGFGGGIFVSSDTTLDLKSVYVLENQIGGNGSAIYASAPGTAVSIDSVMITENAVVGGWGYTVRIDGPTAAQIRSSTLADNIGNGPAVFGVASGSLSAQSLIVWGNDGAAMNDGAGSFTISDSVEQFGVGGTNNIVADPVFMGSTPISNDYHISPTSPAVDHSPTGFYLDVDHESRPFGANFDAGADEAYARVGRNGGECDYSTITEAISFASSGDTIYLPAGVYNERLGQINIDLTFVSATSDCKAENTSAGIDDVLIDANDAVAASGLGGLARIVAPATVTFRKMTLVDGTADYGGVLHLAAGTTVNLDGVWLGWGTAAFLGGGARVLGTLNLLGDTIVYANQTTGTGVGGGISVAAGGTLLMTGNAQIGYPGLGNVSSTRGGGVSIHDSGSAEMRDSSRIERNVAVTDGGGAHLNGIGASLSVLDSAAVENNSALDHGGGIAVTNGAELLVDSTSVSFNSATGGLGYGGGISVLDGVTNPATVTIQNGSMLLGNSAEALGGGIYMAADGGSSTVSLDYTAVFANTSDVFGGGIVANSGGTLSIQSGSLVNNNHAAGVGGGIVISNSSLLDMDDSSVDGNSADLSCGGIYNLDGVLVIGATAGSASISNNVAAANAGGGICDESGNTMYLWATSGFDLVVDNNSAATNGGGIYAAAGTSFDVWGRLHVTNNTAGDHGGGIYQTGGDGYIDGHPSGRPLIAGNTATSGNGGGLYMAGVVDAGANYFDGVDVDGNLAPSGNGGGVFAVASTFNSKNSKVSNNSAANNGGGMYLGSASTATLMTLQTAPAGALHDGGAKVSPCDPRLLAADTYCSEMRGNSSGGTGGGIFITDASTLIADSSAIVGNASSQGAGIYSQAAGDTVSLSTCRVSDNMGNTGVRMLGAGVLTIDSTTVANNAGYGVDIGTASASVTFSSNVIWGNGNGVNSSGATIGGNGCNISQNGVGGLNLNPIFTTTARGAYHLGAGSPAADACGSGPAVDLDNVTRPAGMTWDMGAFERWGGTVSGTVLLQPVRTSTAGATVQAFTAGTTTLVASTTTDAAGDFSLDAAAGSYDVVADLDLYLSAQYSGATVSTGAALTLPDVTLRGGDTDDNGTVGVVDVTYVASRYGSTTEPLADINASGSVDIVDVAATASNYGLSQPTTWP